jgi:hypothetical protein
VNATPSVDRYGPARMVGPAEITEDANTVGLSGTPPRRWPDGLRFPMTGNRGAFETRPAQGRVGVPSRQAQLSLEPHPLLSVQASEPSDSIRPCAAHAVPLAVHRADPGWIIPSSRQTPTLTTRARLIAVSWVDRDLSTCAGQGLAFVGSSSGKGVRAA